MITAKKKTGLIFFPAYDWEISPSHPERQERLLYTQDQVMEEGVLDIEGITEFKAGLATEKDICRAHFCVPDVESRITPSHNVSAGGCIEAARLVMEGVVDNAFALVRPPGHHAMRVVHGARGFCNINIEAVMIEWIRKNYPHIKKIAVVDTDCHHGDGTQDVYWHDPNVLYISLHQDGRTLYPGSGFPEEFGGPNALGRNLNVPLPPRTSDEGMLYVMEHFVMPVLGEFKPDLIINSAGQDNHYSDPITNMSFTAGGYARLNEMLSPHICVLEGGYSIEAALPYVNTGIILALAGVDYSYIREPDLNPARIKEDPRIIDYIKRLTDTLLISGILGTITRSRERRSSGGAATSSMTLTASRKTSRNRFGCARIAPGPTRSIHRLRPGTTSWRSTSPGAHVPGAGSRAWPGSKNQGGTTTVPYTSRTWTTTSIP